MTSTARSVMEKKLATLRRDGVMEILRRRMETRWRHWKLDSWVAGKYVEWACGNIVECAGVKVDLSNPTIRTKEKSAIYFGMYEGGEIALAREMLPRDLPVVEFGASIGVLSCVTNQLLRERGKHVVVEANTNLIPTLRRNRALNGCQFQIVHAALAYGAAEVEFSVNKYFLCGSLNGEALSRIRVPTVSLHKVLGESGFERVSLIVDVEGAEVELVEREIDVIERCVETILLERHPNVVGVERDERMLGKLEGRGFERIGEAEKGGIVMMRKTSIPISKKED